MLLPVHVSQVSVNIASGNVFLADRTLSSLPPWSDEDRDPRRTRQSVLSTGVFRPGSRPGQDIMSMMMMTMIMMMMKYLRGHDDQPKGY